MGKGAWVGGERLAQWAVSPGLEGKGSYFQAMRLPCQGKLGVYSPLGSSKNEFLGKTFYKCLTHMTLLTFRDPPHEVLWFSVCRFVPWCVSQSTPRAGVRVRTKLLIDCHYVLPLEIWKIRLIFQNLKYSICSSAKQILWTTIFWYVWNGHIWEKEQKWEIRKYTEGWGRSGECCWFNILTCNLWLLKTWK